MHSETTPNQRSNRIILEAWERSNSDNNRAGDVMELRWRTPYAKAFIGWWDYTDPDKPVMKAWMGAHDEANAPAAPPHRHWSIEVADESGQMQTRFAVPYDQDHTNITTSSADFSVGWGALRVANGPLEFTTGTDGLPDEQRWRFESTDEAARNFRITGHPNASTTHTVMKFHRDTGYITFGSDHAAERLLHVRAPSAAAVIEGTATTNTGLVLLRHNGPQRRVIQTEVHGDSAPRFSIEANGAMSWGDGASRPLSLSLVLDQGTSSRRFEFDGADLAVQDPNRSRGLILTDRTTNTRYRVYVDNGRLTLEAT